MTNRAYSLLTIKSANDDSRIIEGVATTPATDRIGDIVEPRGATFSLPIPFLWQHKHDSPIGHVIAAKTTDDGINVRIQIAKDDEPGPLKDLLDKSWRSIKKGLVRGLSIGFNPMEDEPIKGTFGLRFTKWDWLELSAVTIPANSEATITTVKHFDSAAATGTRATPSPGASGPVRLTPKREKAMAKTVKEQIKAFEAERAAKDARCDELMSKSAEEGETLDASASEEYDTLTADIEQIDKHLVRLRDREKRLNETAKPVDETPAPTGQAKSERPALRAAQDNVPPGIRFARIARCKHVAARDFRSVSEVAKELYPDDTLVQKGAVLAGSTSATTWAGNLVGDETKVFADFAEFLRPQTILGKFGAGGIPGLRNVPFRTALLGQTSGGAAYWTGEGKAKKLTKFDFSRTTLEPYKCANIAVLTEEVIRASSPAADILVRDALVAALRERLDIDFIDPDKAIDPGVSPASITDSISGIPSAGVDAAAVRADFKALMETFIEANNAPTSGVFVMPSTTALALSLMYNANGVREFPDISLAGGSIFGLPVITSEYVPTDSDGAIVVLVNASDIYLADEGGVSVDVSREASLQMDDGANQSGVGSITASQVVSLWQTNLVGFRAERTINWARRRASAVAYLEAVNYGGEES